MWPFVRDELNLLIRNKVENSLQMKRDGTKQSSLISAFHVLSLDVGDVPPVLTGLLLLLNAMRCAPTGAGLKVFPPAHAGERAVHSTLKLAWVCCLLPCFPAS